MPNTRTYTLRIVFDQGQVETLRNVRLAQFVVRSGLHCQSHEQQVQRYVVQSGVRCGIMIELHHPPPITTHSLDRVTNNNVFHRTEEVTRYAKWTNVESEKSLPSQYQLCTEKYDQ